MLFVQKKQSDIEKLIKKRANIWNERFLTHFNRVKLELSLEDFEIYSQAELEKLLAEFVVYFFDCGFSLPNEGGYALGKAKEFLAQRKEVD